ncbi:MAG: hypothetical protein BWX80_01506 [Candidatus Hydrogenedentes bacterium ADurb.Bin101]|nr:MAG: hypothetical protein BWX80_01506 [Candidatus Hydrogenedentes bacterium ADurb.Bin101]
MGNVGLTGGNPADVRTRRGRNRYLRAINGHIAVRTRGRQLNPPGFAGQRGAFQRVVPFPVSHAEMARIVHHGAFQRRVPPEAAARVEHVVGKEHGVGQPAVSRPKRDEFPSRVAVQSKCRIIRPERPRGLLRDVGCGGVLKTARIESADEQVVRVADALASPRFLHHARGDRIRQREFAEPGPLQSIFGTQYPAHGVAVINGLSRLFHRDHVHVIDPLAVGPADIVFRAQVVPMDEIARFPQAQHILGLAREASVVHQEALARFPHAHGVNAKGRILDNRSNIPPMGPVGRGGQPDMTPLVLVARLFLPPVHGKQVEGAVMKDDTVVLQRAHGRAVQQRGGIARNNRCQKNKPPHYGGGKDNSRTRFGASMPVEHCVGFLLVLLPGRVLEGATLVSIVVQPGGGPQ